MPSDLAIELTSWQAASAGALMNFEDSEIAERARLEAAAAHLAARLRAFEPQYQLSSQEFHRRFSVGELGDDADLFEWSALYQMWLAVREQAGTNSWAAPPVP